MRRVRIGLVAAMVAVMVIVAFVMAGCGGSSETTDTTAATTTTETTAAQAPPTDTSTTQASSTDTSTPPAAGGDGWATITTLRSTDPSWEGLEGLLMSEPFSVSGDIRLVLDMPDAGEVDGVIAALIPAGSFTDASSLIDVIQSGEATMVTLVAQLGPETVSGLQGEYVLVNSVPTDKPWSVEVQSQP